jgi:hypothetical protein
MQNFDILTLVFLGLAIFVIYKLRSVLGQRTGTEKPPQDLMIRREQVAEQPAPGAGNNNIVPLPTVRSLPIRRIRDHRITSPHIRERLLPPPAAQLHNPVGPGVAHHPPPLLTAATSALWCRLTSSGSVLDSHRPRSLASSRAMDMHVALSSFLATAMPVGRWVTDQPVMPCGVTAQCRDTMVPGTAISTLPSYG